MTLRSSKTEETYSKLYERRKNQKERKRKFYLSLAFGGRDGAIVTGAKIFHKCKIENTRLSPMSETKWRVPGDP